MIQGDEPKGTGYETIDLMTIDSFVAQHTKEAIDLIKLDAEGAELSIVDGAKQTISTMSPLIMFELKADNKVNLPLIRKFEEFGYKSYSLIPELPVLIAASV